MVETANSQFGGLDAFIWNFIYLFDVTDLLEQNRARILYQGQSAVNPPCLYSYTHSIVRWKRTLVYLVPGLHRVLAFFERLYKRSCRALFAFSDQSHNYPNKFVAALVAVIIIEELQVTNIEKSDLSAVKHVQRALKSRLQVFCSRIYNYKVDSIKEAKRSENKHLRFLAMQANMIRGLSFCLPSSYQRVLPRFLPERPQFTNLDLPACLLRRFDGGDYHYDNGQTKSCCCGWAFDSTPSGFLRLFDHSARSFARYVHSKPQKIRTKEGEIDFDARQAMNIVFGGPSTDSLMKKVVFRGALTFLFQRLFLTIDLVRQKLEAEMTISENILDDLARGFRPQCFICILRWAVVEYHKFWDSIKDETDAEVSVEHLRRFNIWERKWNDSEAERFVSDVLAIWCTCDSFWTTPEAE